MFLTIASYGQDTILLKRGDVIHGKITKHTDKVVVLEHPDLGELAIENDRIDTVNPEGFGSKPLKEVVPEKEPSLFQKLKDNGWSMSLDFSLDGSYGNTDEQSLRLGYIARRETEEESFKFDTSYYNKIRDGRVSDNKFSAGLRNEWKKDNNFFNFVLGRYDFDEFKSWDQRANVHAGPGYYIIDNDIVDWSVLAGLGLRKEWGSENDSVKFEGVLGTGFRWDITRRQNFEVTYLYFPVIDNTNDYRMLFDFSWRYAIDRDATIEWLIGGLYEFQSVVNEGDKTYDTRIYTGIQFGF